MTRRDDLEKGIRQSYAIIRDYEDILSLSSDPKEQRRAEREIASQWELVRRFAAEYRALTGGPMPADVARIGARSLTAVEPPVVEPGPAQTAGIRAGRIKAGHVVSGVQVQGAIGDAGALAELAWAAGGGIQADEIEAGSVVSGLQSIENDNNGPADPHDVHEPPENER